jgi:hypothetical protein
LLRSPLCEQGSSDEVGEHEEHLRPGGIWDYGTGGARCGVASDFSGRRDECGRWSWDDAAPETNKAGTSAPPTTEGEGSGCGTSDPQEEPPSGGIFAEGMEAVHDEDRCLYVVTPWETEVVTDRCDLEKFKEAAHTIGIVLLVRVLAKFLWFLLWLLKCREVLTTSVARRAVSC